MIRWLLLAALTLLASCKTISPCDFSLKEDGWEPVDNVPQELLQMTPFKKFWYTNADGEFLVCPNRSSKYVCGGTYEVYVRTENGYRQEDFIVCMT
jgi:hypothetical protein